MSWSYRHHTARLVTAVLLSLLAGAAAADERPQLLLQLGHTSGVSSAALSADGKQVAAATLGSVQILEVKSGNSVATLPGTLHMVHHMAFSADGGCLAAACWDGAVKVWEIKSNKTLRTFRHRDRATVVAFHPSGRQLAEPSFIHRSAPQGFARQGLFG